VYLLVRSSGVLLMRGERHMEWPSPYLDKHGEEDPQLRRGRPLFLSHDRYQQLTAIVMGTSAALHMRARDAFFL
jgi:E3 ubiquitin-protein ligase UBR3